MKMKLLKSHEESPNNNQHSAAKNFMLSAAFWLVAGVTMGLLLATKFIAPDFLGGLANLTFGRARPVHVNIVGFGFLSMAFVGAALYVVPRLTGAPILSERLGNITMWLWNVTIAAGVATLLMGYTQAREYAELIWPLDVALVVLLGLSAVNIFGSVVRRTEKGIYVTLWYTLGTFAWFPFVYVIGNVMWNPPSGALSGINDSIWNWFYGHNVLGLWFTTLGVGLWYYLIPRLTKTPLYSHLLSLIGFWSIVFFYTGVGTHHILQAPAPEWLKSISVIFSVALLIPVLTFTTNVGMTLRGNWKKVMQSVPLKFAVAGVIMYLLTCLQGPFQSLRVVNAFLHFGNWTVAHAHLALLGSFGFAALAGIYAFIPEITGRKLYSESLANAHFWLTLVGFVGFFSALTAAGLVQASAWWNHLTVPVVMLQMKPYMIGRALFGGMIVVGQYVFGYNVLRTVLSWEAVRVRQAAVVPANVEADR